MKRKRRKNNNPNPNYIPPPFKPINLDTSSGMSYRELEVQNEEFRNQLGLLLERNAELERENAKYLKCLKKTKDILNLEIQRILYE